jgi:hypothetical protein
MDIDEVIFDDISHSKLSSSNGNSDIEGPASPTSQLLMDYEEHLRNTLEKGLDAESYSLQTFEALLSRSMENLGRFNY